MGGERGIEARVSGTFITLVLAQAWGAGEYSRKRVPSSAIRVSIADKLFLDHHRVGLPRGRAHNGSETELTRRRSFSGESVHQERPGRSGRAAAR